MAESLSRKSRSFSFYLSDYIVLVGHESFLLCAYYLSDVDYFCFPEVYRQVCREEVEQFLEELVRSTRGAGAILYPIHQED